MGKGAESMPGTVVDREQNAKKIKDLLGTNPELVEEVNEFEREYQFRKKLVLARREAGLTQKELEELSGLDQRTISRIEVDEKISPSIKTLIKYLGAMGYELDIIRAK